MNLRKILSLMVILSILFCNAFASDITITGEKNPSEEFKLITKSIPDEYLEYAKENFESLVMTNITDKGDKDFYGKDIKGFKTGKGFQMYTFSDGSLSETDIYYIPVLENKQIIGFLAVSQNDDGKMIACFSKYFAEEMNLFMKRNMKKADFVIFSNNNDICITDGKTVSELHDSDGQANVNDIRSKVLNQYKELDTSEQNNILDTTENDNSTTRQSAISITSVTPESGYIYMSIVRNSGSNCLKATIAAITNYKKGTSLTINDVINYYNTLSGDWITRAIQCYLHYNFSWADYTSPLTYEEVKSFISADNPIHCHFRTTDSSSAHAVAIRGYKRYSSGTRTYSLADPNYGSYVSITGQDYGEDCFLIIGSTKYYWEEIIDYQE